MESKLTLKLRKETIEKGKKYARKRKTSLSRLVENYIEKITDSGEGEISPLVRSLSGLLKGKSFNAKKEYADFLEGKYR